MYPHYVSQLALPLGPNLVNALSRMTQTLGAPEWFDAVLDLLCEVGVADSGGALLLYRHQRPRRIIHRFNAEERQLPEDAFLCGPYALDPTYQLFLQGCPTGLYRLHDIAPDDFYDSEYHRVFYSQIGISDSVDLLWRVDDDTALNFFVERRVSQPGFQDADIIALRTVAPLVFAAAQKHGQLTATTVSADSEGLAHRKVQSTIENFASSLLTRREREVLFYMISGYSSALTARKLDTTEGTVKVHRRSIHRKLDIGSQAELFSLFINCIPFATPDGTADPLQTYQRAPSGAGAGVLLNVLPAETGPARSRAAKC